MTSKLRRRGSLKPKKELALTKSQSQGTIVPHTITLQSVNNMVDIYSQGKGPLTKKSYSKAAGQMFLSGLRNHNKLSLTHAWSTDNSVFYVSHTVKIIVSDFHSTQQKLLFFELGFGSKVPLDNV